MAMLVAQEERLELADTGESSQDGERRVGDEDGMAEDEREARTKTRTRMRRERSRRASRSRRPPARLAPPPFSFSLSLSLSLSPTSIRPACPACPIRAHTRIDGLSPPTTNELVGRAWCLAFISRSPTRTSFVPTSPTTCISLCLPSFFADLGLIFSTSSMGPQTHPARSDLFGPDDLPSIGIVPCSPHARTHAPNTTDDISILRSSSPSISDQPTGASPPPCASSSVPSPHALVLTLAQRPPSDVHNRPSTPHLASIANAIHPWRASVRIVTEKERLGPGAQERPRPAEQLHRKSLRCYVTSAILRHLQFSNVGCTYLISSITACAAVVITRALYTLPDNQSPSSLFPFALPN
ncbi:hypothetical protein BC628DRAFT_1200781 [Trametes gibbosa]|nr:hypothetical protein BC628DRAFT_1200781 [Trametes gibbosa]